MFVSSKCYLGVKVYKTSGYEVIKDWLLAYKWLLFVVVVVIK